MLTTLFCIKNIGVLTKNVVKQYVAEKGHLDC